MNIKEILTVLKNAPTANIKDVDNLNALMEYVTEQDQALEEAYRTLLGIMEQEGECPDCRKRTSKTDEAEHTDYCLIPRAQKYIESKDEARWQEENK